MLKSLLIPLFILPFTIFSPVFGQNQNSTLSQIDEFIETAYDSIGLIPGVAVGIVKNGEVLFKKTYGYSNIDRKEILTTDTQFYIASTTKSFTALSVAILHDRGFLDLNKSLKDYFPKVSFPDSISPGKITLRSLLSHTSGIDNSNISYPKAFSGTYTNLQLFNILDATFGRLDLGEFRYSNLGYNIINLIFLKELGKTWGEVVDEEILKPLKMDKTYYSYVELLENDEDVATNYYSLGNGTDFLLEHKDRKRSDKTLHAAGGLFSSLNDVVKWLQLQTAPELSDELYGIPKRSISSTREEIAIVEPASFGLGKTTFSYGLGWNIGNYNDLKLYHHGGAFGGHRTMISFIPELDLGVVVMVNDGFSGNAMTFKTSTFIYDSYLNSTNNIKWKEEYYKWIKKYKDEINNYGIPSIRNDVANRSTREYDLSVAKEKLSGIYFNSDGDEIRIYMSNNELNIVQGYLIGSVEPYIYPNSIRLDLASVGYMDLDISSGKVNGFTYRGDYYEKY